MAVLATRSVTIVFSGGISANNTFPAANNAASPGQIDTISLASGNNLITPPTGGSTPTAVTIIPPAGNTSAILLKGVNGDTGVSIHKTDPTHIGLNSPTATFVLNAAAIINGVRLVWS